MGCLLAFNQMSAKIYRFVNFGMPTSELIIGPIVHSKAMKGIDYEDGEIVEKLYKLEVRREAVKQLRIVNSTKEPTN